jgi:hypothetical protein
MRSQHPVVRGHAGSRHADPDLALTWLGNRLLDRLQVLRTSSVPYLDP